MTLGEQLDGALAPGPVEVEVGGRRVEAEVEAVDGLGARVGRLRVSGIGAAPEAEAARLPGALRGALPERLAPVEVDPGLGGAILRSEPQDMRGGEFYEVTTDGDASTLERLRVEKDGRSRVPFTLTRDQLRGVVDGLGGS
jgi:hypothetical protein